MKRREFLKIGLVFSLSSSIPPMKALAVNTNLKVIYYWNLHSPPEGLEGAKKIIEEIDPNFIWYAHWITGFPMPPDVNSAYEIAKNCGFSEEKAKKFQKWCKDEAYTLEHVEKQVKAVEGRIYCPCILGYTNFRIDFNFDPITFEPYRKEKIESMLLNFGKWGITNPFTGKTYTLWETQKIFWEKGLPKHNGVFDTSSPDLVDYQVEKAKALKNVGVQAVWYDMFFQLPMNLSKHFGFEHPMIKDLYNGCCDIIDKAKSLGLTVGTWSLCLQFPYERTPNVDFVTASPTVNEILNLKPDYMRWKRIAEIIKEKKQNCQLLIIFDFANKDNLPLPVFSQKLSPKEQCKFLVELTKLAEHLCNDVDTYVAYPIHGPGLGANPKKLAFGKYKIYDALAPEFQTYDTIIELIKGKLSTTKTSQVSEHLIPFVSTLTALIILIIATFKYKNK